MGGGEGEDQAPQHGRWQTSQAQGAPTQACLGWQQDDRTLALLATSRKFIERPSQGSGVSALQVSSIPPHCVQAEPSELPRGGGEASTSHIPRARKGGEVPLPPVQLRGNPQSPPGEELPQASPHDDRGRPCSLVSHSLFPDGSWVVSRVFRGRLQGGPCAGWLGPGRHTSQPQHRCTQEKSRIRAVTHFSTTASDLNYWFIKSLSWRSDQSGCSFVSRD